MARPKQSGARKASKYRAKPIENERAFDRSLSRANKTYNTYEDTMDGDEDAFHLNRDKMLLDDYNDPATAGDHDGLDEPDTVYDLDLPSSDNDDDDEEEEQAQPAPAAKRLPREYKSREKLAAKREDDRSRGRFGHEYDPKQDEVFGHSSDSEDDDEDDEMDAEQLGRDDLAGLSDDEGAPGGKEPADASDDEDEERWAAGHYHVSRRAPGEADSEDDEALELEEEEARRLQRRAREKMDGLDFGVDDDADEAEALGAAADAAGRRARIEDEAANEEGAAAAAESAAAGMGEAEAIAHLLKTQPETLALVDDFVLTASKIKQVETDLEVVRRGDGKGGEHPALAIMELEHQALTTYLPTLAFYFSLLLTPPSAPPVPRALLEKVLARLSSIRERLATMEELDLTSASYGAELDDEDEDEDDEEAEEGAPRKRAAKRARDDSMLASEMLDFHSRLAAGGDDDDDSDLDLDAEEDDDDDEDGEEVTDSMLAGLDDDELEQIMAQLEPGQGAEELLERVRAKQREKAGLDALDDEDAEAGMMSEDEEEEERRIAAARKAKKLAKKQGKSGAAAIPTLAPLSHTPPSSAAAAPRAAAAGSDLLDPLSLSASDRADKASSRHTLRFHVSQVAQKAAKRDARRRGLEGDDDVPRRSKEHARREVLKRQEHGAARDAHKGAGLDGDEFGEDDRRAARAVRGEADDASGGDGDDGDDYYDLVAAEKEEGRRAKKARYDDARAAEKAEIEALSAASTDGPRGATRQILANKGLTPKRKKENRNARVKKRRQYDDKKKKLRSMKAHYGGGEARTGYEGERSGISRSTVKSVKLG